MYQLSSSKIPEYLNSNVDTRSSKAGKALNDPQTDLELLTVISTLQALKSDKCSAVTEMFAHFVLQLLAFEI